MSKRTSTSTTHPLPLATTGIAGLDQVLNGGLTPNRLYLVEGAPGSGKTTLALQFLLEGVRLGESVLYVTLSETTEELRAVGMSHGWSLDGVHMFEMMPTEDDLRPDRQSTIFHPSEIELGVTTNAVLREVERVKPTRVIFDSLSEMRLLAGNPLRYRRQILALKQFFTGRRCTVVLLDDRTSGEHDLQIHSLAHGVIMLEQLHPEFGAERRRFKVVKYRGMRYRGGHHDFVIRRGGIEVFPRLIAAENRHGASREQLRSGVAALDLLLGGGIERGTSTLVTGAAGTGKSTIAGRFLLSAAERGERGALFIFDESQATFLARMKGLGMDLAPHIEAERIVVQQVDPAELSPGEFIHTVRRTAQLDGTSIVVIDSLNGYLQAMPEEHYLIVQLHELFTYLGQLGIATMLIAVQHGFVGANMTSPVDVSYIADTVVLLRYFEVKGEVRQAMSIVKKRAGAHERTVREFRLNQDGIWIGEPLRGFRGVLSGVPVQESDTSSNSPRPST